MTTTPRRIGIVRRVRPLRRNPLGFLRRLDASRLTSLKTICPPAATEGTRILAAAFDSVARFKELFHLIVMLEGSHWISCQQVGMRRSRTQAMDGYWAGCSSRSIAE